MISCAHICLSDHHCCMASFSKGTSTCRIDSSGRCCVETKTLEGWRSIQRNSYLPITYTGCINFGNSSYSIFEEHIGWDKAKENFERLGGKLAELETLEENEFIKEEVRTRNTGVEGYWIGGFNFHKDFDMEWVSQPNQTMSFCDMESGQPNRPQDQLCMVIWKEFNFRWDLE
ncbi:perlucin-like protein [Mytilus californianus]|uniref:perlucin-like protein n=1 Tax=Mytilus californianus TaxID=6549 RepID=UPI002245D549|nr:perlucin-like protein [Mytilus californianus]